MNRLMLILLLILPVAASCAGARGALSFEQLRYPVSASGYIHTAPEVEGIVVIGELFHTLNIWGLFYSVIPVSGTVDVSNEINHQIQKAGGEGVINLSVVTDNCGINYVWPLSWLPFWPGCVAVGIQGQIVRRTNQSGDAKPRPDPRSPLDATAVEQVVRTRIGRHPGAKANSVQQALP